MADASKTESMVYCNVTEIDHYVHDVRLNFQWGKQSCHIPEKVNFAEQKKEMFLSSRDVVLEMSSNLKSQISNLKSQSSILGHVTALVCCNVCNQVLCFASYWLHFKPVWSIGHLAMCHMVTKRTVTVNEDLLLWKMNMAAHLCWKTVHIFTFELTSAQNLADVSFTMNSY